MSHYLLGFAQQAPASGGGGGTLMQMAPLLLIFAVFYFLVIRPQSKKQKDHQAWLKQLKTGDKVVTQGGVLGRVTGLKDDEVTLEVCPQVRLRVLRSAITGKQKSTDEPAKAEDKAS